MPYCDIILSMEAFVLGLANGVVCIGYCAPVLVPYLLGQNAGVRANILIVVRFLGGRLAGYLAFSFIAWAFHVSLLRSFIFRDAVVGGSYIILSILLVIYGFFKKETSACAAGGSGALLNRVNIMRPSLTPIVLGLLTGLTICPPFLLAFTSAAREESLAGSIVFFLLFFCGTSIFFLPFPLIGTLRRIGVISTVGRLASGVIGLYYFYAGLLLLSSVIKTI